MADIKYEVEFQAVSTGDGAERLASQIERIKELSGEARKALNEQGIDPFAPVAEGAKKAAAEIPAVGAALGPTATRFKLAQEEAARLREELAGATSKLPGFKDAVESIISPTSQGEVSVSGLKKAITALGSESATVSALGLAGLVVGVALLVKAADDAGEPIANLILDLQGLNKEAVSTTATLAKLEKQQLRLEAQSKSLDDLNERLVRDREQADNLTAALLRLNQSQRDVDTAKAQRESSQRIAASGNAPEVIAAEAARMALLKANNETLAETEKSEAEVKKAKDEVARLTYQQAGQQRVLAQATQDRERFEQLVRDHAEALGISYAEAVKLAKDQNALQKKINDLLATKVDADTIRAGQLRDLGTAGKAAAEAAGTESKATTKVEVTSTTITTATANLQTAMNLFAATQDRSASAMIEAGREIGQSVATMKTSIADLQQQLATAKAAQTQAATTNAPSEVYVAAAAKVVALQQQVDAAKREQDAVSKLISESAASYQQSLSTGARGFETEAKRAEEQTKRAASEAGGAAKAGGATIVKAADQFHQATVEGAQSMNGGINKMADTVVSVTNGVAQRLDVAAERMGRQFEVINRRLDAVARTADTANRTASTAILQIEASR